MCVGGFFAIFWRTCLTALGWYFVPAKKRDKRQKRKKLHYSLFISSAYQHIIHMMTLPLLAKRAAIAQLCSTASKHSNLLNVAKCASMAKKQGASMLFLPECFGFIGSNALETLDNAEVISTTPLEEGIKAGWLSDLENIIENGDRAVVDGMNSPPLVLVENSAVSIVKGLRTIAAKSGLWISGGGLHEMGAPPSPDDESKTPRVYNTHVIIDSAGQVVTKYRKVHLFDLSIPSEGVHLRESATTAPGTNLVVCDSPIGKLGLTTCYDVRFPEMYTALAEEGGADILLVPSAFTVPTGKAHWHTLLRGKRFYVCMPVFQFLFLLLPFLANE